MRPPLFPAAALAVALLPGTALAGDLAADRVSEDAEWVLHVNVEALVDSPLGQFILEHGEEMDLDLNLDDIRNETGLDPVEDFRSVTVYGRGEPGRNAVVLVVLSEKVDDLLEMLEEKAGDDYDRTRISDHVVHVFEDGDESMYLHVRPLRGDDRLGILSGSRRSMRRALAVIEGDRDSLESDDATLQHRPGSDSVIFIETGRLPWVEADEDPASMIIRRSRSIVLDIGQSKTHTHAMLRVAAGDEQMANDIAEVLQGLAALGRLMADSQPELEPLEDLLAAVSIQSDDESIVVRCEGRTETITEHLLDLAEHHH